MAKKEERNLNITLKNQEEDREEIIISISAFIRALRRFVIFWLVAAIIIGVLVPVYFALFTADQHKNLQALVSFNYSGIEKGLAPDGTKFDVNTLKNPAVIEQTLTEMGLPLTHLEGIRQGISIEGVTPTSVIDNFTVYKTPYEAGSISAAQKILETTIYPTQFIVTFNYSASGLVDKQPVEVFNLMLNNYSQYFFETYGYNRALGSAILALDYKTYDYAEQIDVFDNSLSSIQNYVSTLSKQDNTHFRSTTTGNSFSDLSQAISTIRDVDLNMLSAQILMNNITKDKQQLMDYYTRCIENFTRDATATEAQLNAVTQSITEYQVGTVIVYADGDGGTTYNEPSSAYDDLFEQKVTLQRTLTAKREQIKDYQKRLNRLKTQPANTTTLEDMDARMDALSAKINDLINKTNATANDYYETVYLSNAYQVLVPATSSGLTTTKSVIKSAIEPLFIIEALLFVLFFGYAFCYSLITETRKRRAIKLAEHNAADDDDNDEETSAESSTKTTETEEQE